MTTIPRRQAGVLLHPTSLPGPHGIGDLGAHCTRFLDWSTEAGLGVWQVLPLGPTAADHSPYSSLSAFAGNPLLISLERLVEAGWSRGFEEPGLPEDRVDFARLVPWKVRRLRESWEHFGRHAPARARQELEAFREDPEQADWLEDWALFAALKERFDERAWFEWDAEFRRREAPALRRAARELAGGVDFQCYLQFVFYRQWSGVRHAARARGIRLLGDAPYYVAHDSADVWTHRHLFEVDDDGRPLKVAGVPPDYFSETGQLWGNPLYRWDRMRADGYAWWASRVRSNLRQVDLLRLDHFRGFAAFWEIEAGRRTAAGGRWVAGPGRELFDALRARLGTLPLVAEDLGLITADVVALREELGLPGMHVLQFAFSAADSPDRPELHRRHAVVYTGTHDNDTSRGWFSGLDPAAKSEVLAYLRVQPEGVVEGLIRTAYGSVADLAVVPLQDLLGLGGEARMNLPGTASGNWGWRVDGAELTLERAHGLRVLARENRRLRGSRAAR